MATEREFGVRVRDRVVGLMRSWNGVAANRISTVFERRGEHRCVACDVAVKVTRLTRPAAAPTVRGGA